GADRPGGVPRGGDEVPGGVLVPGAVDGEHAAQAPRLGDLAEILDHRVRDGRGVRGDHDAGEGNGRVAEVELGGGLGAGGHAGDDLGGDVLVVRRVGRHLAAVLRVVDPGDDEVGAGRAAGGRDGLVVALPVAGGVRLLVATGVAVADEHGARGDADARAGRRQGGDLAARRLDDALTAAGGGVGECSSDLG